MLLPTTACYGVASSVDCFPQRTCGEGKQNWQLVAHDSHHSLSRMVGKAWVRVVLSIAPPPTFTVHSAHQPFSVLMSSLPSSISDAWPVMIVTWLILPVVICLSQRLSHACLSISNLYSETANGSLNQLSFI